MREEVGHRGNSYNINFRKEYFSSTDETFPVLYVILYLSVPVRNTSIVTLPV